MRGNNKRCKSATRNGVTNYNIELVIWADRSGGRRAWLGGLCGGLELGLDDGGLAYRHSLWSGDGIASRMFRWHGGRFEWPC